MKDAKLYQARLAELGYWHCRDQQGWKGVMCAGGHHTCRFILHGQARPKNYRVIKLKSDRWL